ncbi:unnamed protein product [Blepharisma stoltei]|uniref:Uncharacterized protein n=1 Tax=Blepharisma stoltei TaxID=1481888 RepID=A0AAU9K4V6_9CILI|nr:unnamed protein product [Blepharisma stoltei]
MESYRFKRRVDYHKSAIASTSHLVGYEPISEKKSIESPKSFFRNFSSLDTNIPTPNVMSPKEILSPKRQSPKLPITSQTLGYLSYKNDALKLEVEKEKFKHQYKEYETKLNEYITTINQLKEDVNKKDSIIEKLGIMVKERELQFRALFKENISEFEKVVKEKDEIIENLNKQVKEMEEERMKIKAIEEEKHKIKQKEIEEEKSKLKPKARPRENSISKPPLNKSFDQTAITEKIEEISKNIDIDKIDQFLVSHDESLILDMTPRSAQQSTDNYAHWVKQIETEIKILTDEITEIKKIIKAIISNDKLSINLLLSTSSQSILSVNSQNIFINQARREVFEIKSLISDGYAEQIGTSCQLQ